MVNTHHECIAKYNTSQKYCLIMDKLQLYTAVLLYASYALKSHSVSHDNYFNYRS